MMGLQHSAGIRDMEPPHTLPLGVSLPHPPRYSQATHSGLSCEYHDDIGETTDQLGQPEVHD